MTGAITTTPSVDDEDVEAADDLIQSWSPTLFEDAQTDLRWYKERSASVVQWTLVVFAGLATAATNDVALVQAFSIVAVLQAIYATGSLYRLYRFGRSTRLRVRQILPQILMPTLYPRLSDRDPHHVFHLTFDIGIILIALAVALWAIW